MIFKNKNEAIKSSTDLLLYLLYAPGYTRKKGESIKGATRLQKLMFILEKSDQFKETVNFKSDFIAYNYGPFSSNIFDSLEFLKDLELIQIKSEQISYSTDAEEELELFRDLDLIESIDSNHISKTVIHVYELTDKGIQIAEKKFEKLPDEIKEKICKIKSIYNHMSLQELLTFVYRKFPEYTKKSDIRRKILGEGYEY